MSPGRPVTHRTALLEAVRELALAKGFPATTVDEICERAGAAKGSFYYHFTGKDDIGLAAVQAFFDDLGAAFAAGDWVKAEDPLVRLQQFLDHAAQVCSGPLMAHGCLLGSFTLDLAESSPQIRKLLSSMFGGLRDMVAELVAEAAAQRGVRLDPTALGDHFLAVVEGSILLAKAHGDRDLPGRSLALFGQHLELLLAAAPENRAITRTSAPQGPKRRRGPAGGDGRRDRLR